MDAHNDLYDVAMLVSGDTDLIPPIRAVRESFAPKKIGIAFPPMRHSIALQNVVDYSFIVGKKKLGANQMPSEIKKPNGYILKRPQNWK